METTLNPATLAYAMPVIPAAPEGFAQATATDGNVARGAMFALLFSLPLWAVISGAAAIVMNAGGF